MKKLTLKSSLFIAIMVIPIILFISSCQKSGDEDTVTPPKNVPVVDTSHNVNQSMDISITKALPNSSLTLTVPNTNTNIIPGQIIATINGVQSYIYAVGSMGKNAFVDISVPANATSGKIKLYTAGITYTSSASFTVQTATFSTINTGHIEHIAVDAAGNIYGEEINKIYKITPSGNITTFATVGANATLLWGIAIDGGGNIYTPSQTDHKIYKITPQGVISTYAGTGAAGYADGQGTTAVLNNPMGLAIDIYGNLYFNDTHRVRYINNTGYVGTTAGNSNDGSNDGSGANASFGNNEGIAVDAAGDIYVSDTEYHNIRKIFAGVGGFVVTVAGNISTAGFNDSIMGGLNAQFTHPQGMAVDAAGNVFISDSDTKNLWTVRMMNMRNGVTTFLKSTGSAIGAGAINFTDGITFDAAGNMYICNTGVGTVTKVNIK